MTHDIDRDAPNGPAREPRERATDVWEREPQAPPCRERQPVPGRGPRIGPLRENVAPFLRSVAPGPLPSRTCCGFVTVAQRRRCAMT